MPTVLVGLAWLGLSSATTIYISWLDQRHQEVMSENVASIRAAAVMQHALWELQVVRVNAAVSSVPATPLASTAIVEAEFRVALADADSAAFTFEEQQVVEQIHDKFEQYLRELNRSQAAQETPMPLDRGTAIAAEIANYCDQLRFINQRLIEQRSADHVRWSGRVGGTRVLVAVLGPLIGVWLGYRVASRLRRRLAAIHVTLEGAAGEFGRVLVDPTEPDGNLDAIDRQVRDVAARMDQALAELEGARREAARNERLIAVGQLAAGVAHELRNPLTAVKLLVQTAVQRAAKDGLRPEPLAVVQDEIARMENTIQSLLDFARPPDSQRVTSDVRETLCRAVNLVQGRAAQEKIRIEVSNVKDPLWVLCDPEQLHQVFVNLLMNGMDAMPSGGTLTIELRRPEPLPNQVLACEVAVIDQGAGILPALLDRIFEPFVTTKSRGTGLGLAISRRLVEDHGGHLTAMNGAEQGAVFVVRLPCQSTPGGLVRSSAATVTRGREVNGSAARGTTRSSAANDENGKGWAN